MVLSARWFSLSLLAFVVMLAGEAAAVQPSEKLLPNTTKAFVACPSLEQFQVKFDATQLGEFVNDPAMQAFVEDLRAQLRGRMDHAGIKLGIKWADLEGVDAGEVALGLIQPNPADKNSHATVLLVDVTGKATEATKLLAKIDANLAARKATKATSVIGGVSVITLTLAPKAGDNGSNQVLHFIHNDQLVITDHAATAAGIIARTGGEAADSLATLGSFRQIMDKTAHASGDVQAQLKWFVDPFGVAEVSRAISAAKRRRGKDMLKILSSQGLAAFQGVGGQIFFATESEELLHRTFVYAPAVIRKPGDKSTDKYNLAMRMFDFPNSPGLLPQNWVPADVCAYISFHWKLQNAFNHSESLVDAAFGDPGTFKEMLQGLKQDPDGPMIDVQKDLVNFLGERVTILSDVRTPITTKSERMLVAIEVTDSAAVALAVAKAFKTDPQAKLRQFEGHDIWEIVNEQNADNDPKLTIEGEDAGFVAVEEEKMEEDKPVLPNMAITVFDGHLVVGTNIDFVEEVIKNAKGDKHLVEMADYQAVTQALSRLGAGSDSCRIFNRTDEAYRATYELLRQGKLPEAETAFARILNGIMAPEEEGEIRKQEIDGSKLPPFEQMQKYLGPSGCYIRSEDDGWMITGCLLKKGT